MQRTVEELSRELGGEVRGDGQAVVTGVASLEQATKTDLAFLDSPRRLPAALSSRAGALIAPPEAAAGDGAELDRPVIIVADPRHAFARAVALFHPPPAPAPGIHPSAVVDASAEIGPDVEIGPHVTIAAQAVIGARAVIGAGSVVGRGARIGADSVLMPRVVLYPGTALGERVLIHAGAVLGADGFGFARGADGRLVKFRQIGQLRIEDDVEIGANTTVDRGALGATVIGRGSKVDNLVQIAHNVAIGRDCAVSAQVGIAGSAQLEEGVTLAGQVGIADHVRIERGAMVGAQAGVPSHKIVRAGQVMWGTPARPLDEFKRQFGHLSRLADLRQQVKALDQRLLDLEAQVRRGEGHPAEPTPAIDRPESAD